MNPLNYASLEASKRLADAGIVLETDFYWYRISKTAWRLINKVQIGPGRAIPAPSMAEVWREFPGELHNVGALLADKTTGGDTYAGYVTSLEHEVKGYIDRNPADALIDLLIWVKKGGGQ